MLELRQTDIAGLYQAVAEAINVATTNQGFNLPCFGSEMMNKAKATASLYIEPRFNRECQTGYDSNCLEYMVWGLALLAAA